MAEKNPLSYTGRVKAGTLRLGDAQLDSTDFSVTDQGKVSLSATSVAETFSTDSGTATPASSAITVAGGNGIDTSGSSATVTVAIENDYLVHASGTISNAEIKALRATPKTLVAAPGAGLVLVFEKLILKLNYGSEVLTESDDDLVVKYTNASGVAVSDVIEATGFIDQSADTVTFGIPIKDPIVAYSSAANQALVLDQDGDGEYGGNASNDTTITYQIWYRVATI